MCKVFVSLHILSQLYYVGVTPVYKQKENVRYFYFEGNIADFPVVFRYYCLALFRPVTMSWSEIFGNIDDVFAFDLK